MFVFRHSTPGMLAIVFFCMTAAFSTVLYTPGGRGDVDSRSRGLAQDGSHDLTQEYKKEKDYKSSKACNPIPIDSISIAKRIRKKTTKRNEIDKPIGCCRAWLEVTKDRGSLESWTTPPHGRHAPPRPLARRRRLTGFELAFQISPTPSRLSS